MTDWFRVHIREAIRVWREEHPDEQFPATLLLAIIDEWEAVLA